MDVQHALSAPTTSASVIFSNGSLTTPPGSPTSSIALLEDRLVDGGGLSSPVPETRIVGILPSRDTACATNRWYGTRQVKLSPHFRVIFRYCRIVDRMNAIFRCEAERVPRRYALDSQRSLEHIGQVTDPAGDDHISRIHYLSSSSSSSRYWCVFSFTPMMFGTFESRCIRCGGNSDLARRRVVIDHHPDIELLSYLLEKWR